MGTRKLYQQEILQLLENASEPVLLQVINHLKEAEEQVAAAPKTLTPFGEAMQRITSGYWKNCTSSSDEFAAKKAIEKQLDR